MSSFMEKLNSMTTEGQRYMLESLAQHLYLAGQYERLHRLLTSKKDWLEAKFTFLNRGLKAEFTTGKKFIIFLEKMFDERLQRKT